MISGPLDPETLKRHAPEFTPAGARFILESCILRKVNLDADTVLLILEIARRDKPGWEPRTGEAIMRARLESRGIALPPERKPETPIVEVSEMDLGEEKTL